MCSHADLELAGILLPLLLLRAGVTAVGRLARLFKGVSPSLLCSAASHFPGSKDDASRRLGEAIGSGQVARRSLGRVGEADGLLEGPYLDIKVVKILH